MSPAFQVRSEISDERYATPGFSLLDALEADARRATGSLYAGYELVFRSCCAEVVEHLPGPPGMVVLSEWDVRMLPEANAASGGGSDGQP